MNNCESNEVPIRTLEPGSCCALVLSHTTEIRAVVLWHLAGSTLVDTGASRKEHWDFMAPVVFHPKETKASWLRRERPGKRKRVKS